MPRRIQKEPQAILLKNGLIVDGTGAKPYTGNLLIRAGRIHRISPRPIRTTAVAIDCSGMAVAPGFIDAHSHLDWHLPIKAHDELKYPFLAQGITTVVAGNCGFSAAGFREGTTWRVQVGDVIQRSGLLTLEWDAVEDLFARMAGSGMSHNLALLAGHGTARASIRGFDPSPLHPYEAKELFRLLEAAMDQGARGVSLGLQHQPGMFASPEELKEIALLVKRRSKILAAHARTPPVLAPAPPKRRFGEATMLSALRELLDLARRTGVRIQLSHLVFVGSRTWHAADAALRLIDEAITEGVDVGFDVCPHAFSVSRISAALPPWFLARGPAAYGDGPSVRRLKREVRLAERRLGFGPSDVQVTDIGDPDMAEYNGKLLSEIARLRRLSPEDALLEIARRSEGKARIFCHKCSNDGIVEALMRHPAALFMTDAWVERSGLQNPAAYGAFPRFLQIAREKGLLTIEETVRKMTGATAERFGIRDRGILREKLAADITVFDWEAVKDNTTPRDTDEAPSGIEYVFVNGRKIIGSGRRESTLSAGIPLP